MSYSPKRMVRIRRPAGCAAAGEGPGVEGVGDTERARPNGGVADIEKADRSGRLDGPAIGISGLVGVGFGWGGLSLSCGTVHKCDWHISKITLTSAACRLRSNLSLSPGVMAVLEVSRSSGFKISSKMPFASSSSLLSSFSFPFPWTGNLSRTTIRRGGDSGGRGGVIFSCGRLTGEECSIALRVRVRVRPRGRRGDSRTSPLRSEVAGVAALRLPPLWRRGWITSEQDVEVTDDSRNCSKCWVGERPSSCGVWGTASQIPDGLCVQDGQCHFPGGESCSGGLRQSICQPLSQESQKRIRAFQNNCK